jgi:hypothetical protein
MTHDEANGSVTLDGVTLPLFMMEGGRVAHVAYRYFDRYFETGSEGWLNQGPEGACHIRGVWAPNRNRLATPGDPTCKKCLAAIRKWTGGKVRT